MRIESLEYLVDFADLGSITATANKNYMSEQGISRIFRQMEKECGVSLFYREGKLLRLTEAGESIVENAREIVEGYKRITDAANSYARDANPDREDLCLFVTPLVSLCLLPLFGLDVPSDFPFQIRLREEDLGLFNLVSNPIEEGRGIGIVTDPHTASSESFIAGLEKRGLTFEPLFDSEVVAYVSASSPIARSDQLMPGQYEDYVSGDIGIACPKDDAVLDQIDEVVREENIRIVCSNMHLIKEQVRRGQVTMMAPKILLLTLGYETGITWIPLQEKHMVRFGLLLSKEHRQNSNIMLMTGHIKKSIMEALSKLPPQQYAHLLY